MYSRYVTKEKEQIKKNQFYGFYVRPMISWNLTCEKQGKTRLSIISGLSTSGSKNNTSIMWMNVEISLVLLLTTISIVWLLCLNNQRSVSDNRVLGRVVVSFSIYFLIFTLSWLILYHTNNAALSSEEVKNTLESYSVVNGCSDSLTKVDVDG